MRPPRASHACSSLTTDASVCAAAACSPRASSPFARGAPCFCGRAPSGSVSLRTHEAGPGGFARLRARLCTAVAVDSMSGIVFEASRGRTGNSANDKFCPSRWAAMNGSLSTPLLDSSLAATVRAMGLAGVADKVVDSIYMSNVAMMGHADSSHLSTPCGAYDGGVVPSCAM